MNLDHDTDSLIARARDGSSSGLGQLLETYSPLLYRLAEQQVGTRLRVRLSGSDLVQDTLLTASQKFHAFRGDTEGEFRKWLVQVFYARLNDGLRRHLLAERRRRARDRSAVDDLLADPSQSPSVMAVLNEQCHKLASAIVELGETDREILLMRYTEQLGFAEIAERLGLPLANVWRRWSRSVETLRKQLDE
jgi:RNA polymerase sigma-70 factor (ECF subfamily)